MAEVRLENLHKNFGSTQAVAGLSLTVTSGEFLVLLGPSGAGKTTTLRLVAGLETPDQGRVWIEGQDATRWHSAERDVAFVFQQYSLYPHYTVFDNLAFPLRSPRRRTPEPEVKRRVEEVAEMLRIGHKLRNKATQLSGGEMQRVAIGRALVRQPRVFLMDEPMSSLDAKLREDLRAELKRIQVRLGATLLYVTHDQVEATTMADRIGILRQGRLEQVATPQQTYNDPNSIYVAQRLGSPPINVLPASLVPAAPGGAVSVGVRPEDVLLGSQGQTAKVELTESLGAQHQVLLSIDGTGQEVRALVGLDTELKHGQKVSVHLPTDKLLFFGSAGERIRV
jgi:multiple sugar transport system ATP-binding protein